MGKQILHLIILFLISTVTSVTAHDRDFYQRLLDRGYAIINVENDGLRAYLDDRSYDNPELMGNYGFSVVGKYSKGVPSRPAGILLKWDSGTSAEDITSVVVTLVELDWESDESLFDGDLSDMNAKYYYPAKEGKEYVLCNMCPQKYCYYQIEEVLQSGVRNMIERGRFYSDGQIRMLRVDGMVNVRDFGGWYTIFGPTVSYGRLFRGNRPEGITPTGRNDFVVNEHVTADLDLRGSNLSKSPLGPLETVEYFCTNNQRYKLALTSSTDVLARDLEIIADVLGRGGSVFLHCNHGANRAGTLSFLIEGILGLNEADLSRDYELSAYAWGTTRGRTYGEMLPYIRSYGEEDDDLAQCFYNYARSIGASEDTLDTIRCVMLGLDRKDARIVGAHR